MRIGFDGKRAVYNMTGLGNYSRSLIEALSRLYPDNEYLLYAPGLTDNPRLAPILKSNNAKVIASGQKGGVFNALWRSFGVRKSLREGNLDVFHGLSNELPFGIAGAPYAKVATIHDLIFLRYPQYYPWLDRQVYRRKSAYVCKIADAVVAVSQQTKEDIIHFLGADPNRIHVIYQNCDTKFTRAVSEDERSAVRARYNLPSQFVLYVSSIEERKNLLTLVKAIGLLRKRLDLFLVAIGNGSNYKQLVLDHVAAHGLSDRVQLRSDIAFADFPAIYQSAQVLVYPSHFEGFGIPIIEALWSKTPVITSKGGCFPEAGGPSSLYISPESAEEIAEALSRVLSDSSLRAKMIAGGLSHVQKFREDNVTRQMMELYGKLVQRTS